MLKSTNITSIPRYSEKFIFQVVSAPETSDTALSSAEKPASIETIPDFLNAASEKLISQVYTDAIALIGLQSEQDRNSTQNDSQIQAIQVKYQEGGDYAPYATVLEQIIGNLNQSGQSFQEKMKTKIMQRIFVSLNYGSPLRKEDFQYLVDILGCDHVGPDGGFEQMEIREITVLVIKLLKQKEHLAPYINSLDPNKRENFLALANYYGMLTIQEISDIVIKAPNAQDSQTVISSILNKKHDMQKTMQGMVEKNLQMKKLLQDLEKILIENQFDENKPEDYEKLNAIYIKLQALGWNMDRAISYVSTQKNLAIEQGLREKLAQKNNLNSKLQTIIKIFENLITNPSQTELPETNNNLHQAITLAQDLNDNVAISVLTYIKNQLSSKTPSPADCREYINFITAYQKNPETLRNIEIIFEQASLNNQNIHTLSANGTNFPNALTELKQHLDLLSKAQVDVTALQNFYANLSKLDQGYQQVRQAISQLQNPSLDEIYNTLNTNPYGTYFIQIASNNLSLEKLPKKQRARKLRQFLLTIKESDVGLTILQNRKEVATSLADLEKIISLPKFIEQYKQLATDLQNPDGFDKQKMKTQAQTLLKLANDLDLDPLLRQNITNCLNDDTLTDLTDDKIRKQISVLEKQSGQISGADLHGELSRLSTGLNPQDTQQLQQRIEAIRTDDSLTPDQKELEYGKLITQYNQQYSVSVDNYLETGADMGQDMVYKSRNRLMRHCTYSGLLKVVIGTWGIATTAVNGAATLFSLATSGYRGDFKTAWNRLTSNMLYLGLGAAAIKYSHDSLSTNPDKPTYLYGMEGLMMAKWLQPELDINNPNGNLEISEERQIALFILGNRQIMNNDENLGLNIEIMKAVEKAGDQADQITSLDQLNNYYQQTLNSDTRPKYPLNKPKIAEYLAQKAQDKDTAKADWLAKLNNQETEKQIVQHIIELVRYGQWNKCDPNELSKTANACLDYLPNEEQKKLYSGLEK